MVFLTPMFLIVIIVEHNFILVLYCVGGSKVLVAAYYVYPN